MTNNNILRLNNYTESIIGAAIEVHKALGPGLLESAYQKCLEYELKSRGLNFQSQVDIPVRYKGLEVGCAYKADLIVESAVILELKAVEKLLPVHQAQLLTYMRLSKLNMGLLVNFNQALLKNGIRRMRL